MPQDGVHTFNEGAWHYCGRCDRRAKLDTELQWQYGKLLCFDCYDNYPVLLGAIEQQQANVTKLIDSNRASLEKMTNKSGENQSKPQNEK